MIVHLIDDLNPKLYVQSEGPLYDNGNCRGVIHGLDGGYLGPVSDYPENFGILESRTFKKCDLLFEIINDFKRDYPEYFI